MKIVVDGGDDGIDECGLFGLGTADEVRFTGAGVELFELPHEELDQ